MEKLEICIISNLKQLYLENETDSLHQIHSHSAVKQGTLNLGWLNVKSLVKIKNTE